MENIQKISSGDESLENSLFSRNTVVTKLLELCIQPTTTNEMITVLSDFWNKFEECVSEFGYFDEDTDVGVNEINIFAMYAMSFIYEKNNVSLLAVSNTCFAYLMQIKLLVSKKNQILLNSQNGYLEALQIFAELGSADIFVPDAIFQSLRHGNLGLMKFLVKFKLVEFHFEADEEVAKFVQNCVDWFKDANCDKVALTATPMQFEDLLSCMMQHKGRNLKRSLLTFCAVCISSEYRQFEGLNEPYLSEAETLKDICVEKLACLEQFLEASSEPYITLKDTESFIELFLDRYLNNIGRWALCELFKKLFSENCIYFDPRSLKDLTRCSIRSRFQSSAMLPEQVHKLPIPDSIQQFILFHEQTIWKYLKDMHHIIYARETELRSICSKLVQGYIRDFMQNI